MVKNRGPKRDRRSVAAETGAPYSATGRSTTCQVCRNPVDLSNYPNGRCYRHQDSPGGDARVSDPRLAAPPASLVRDPGPEVPQSGSSEERMRFFLEETELGDHFDPDTAQLAEDGRAFDVTVEVPFGTGGERYREGDRVRFGTANLNLLGTMSSGPNRSAGGLPHRLDPMDCGCTDCIIGWSRPLGSSRPEERVLARSGMIGDATAGELAEFDEERWNNGGDIDPDLNDPEDDPAYREYLAEMEEDHRRSEERVGQKPPMEWGTRLDGEHYFCHSCWYRGDETGAHPYSEHPCDPPGTNRGPYDPR